MNDERMEQILDALSHGHQRATYGAVAAVVGASPRTLMSGRERDPRHSWVVRRQTGLPTGYEDDQLHPQLLQSDHVIESREELLKWMSIHADEPLVAQVA